MRMRTSIGLLAFSCATWLFAACFQSETTKCGKEGPTCPAGWECIAELSACINPLETLCGNGIVDPNEACDDGNFKNDDECNWNCQFPSCGDGFKRTDVGEVCDDGNKNRGDGCSADCRSLEVCGDGYVNDYPHANPNEECDSGGVDTAECDKDCTARLCGDGYTNSHPDAKELCDGGDPVVKRPVDTPECNDNCTPASCGDTHVNTAAGEQCDNGRYCANETACTSNSDCAGIGDGLCVTRNLNCCTAECKNPKCGNGVVEPECQVGDVLLPLERCDDGSACSDGRPCEFDVQCAGIGDAKCQPRRGDGCSDNCLSRELCGDGVVNDYEPYNEVCDDGNVKSGDGCSANCRSLEFCGDGILNDYAPYNEVCDDGRQCADGSECNSAEDCVGIGTGNCVPRNGDGCSSLCNSTEVCGDGVVSTYPIQLRNAHPMVAHPNVGETFLSAEACDDGNTADGDGCSSDCLSPESCGDGYFNDYTRTTEAGTFPPELCDDGNNNNGDGCSANCGSLEQCGNGITDPGEECDDNNQVSGDGCTRDCLIEGCGNGRRDTGEQCDNGELNGDNADCTLECALNVCGDRLVNKTVGTGGKAKEECDNGTVNTATCNLNCTLPRCGDGLLNFDAGEFCDEGAGAVTGESRETLRCNVDCTFAFCGDGVLNATRGERCDDGNNDDGDGCSADCRSTELCGDGVINRSAPQLEVCDDGASCEDGSPCAEDADCASGLCLPRDGDGCSEDCRSTEICGDAYLNNYAPYGETCDDGNVASLDGCNGTSCKLEAGWRCLNLGQPCTEICGDGLVTGAETCDEGSTAPSTGCSACRVVEGWTCPATTVPGSTAKQGGLCTPRCGDRLVRGNETCDDGNAVATDGCDATCKETLGWDCPTTGGVGGTCLAICGDLRVVGTELCDDGANISGDGCDSGCRLESGWTCPNSGGSGGACTPICGDGQVRGVETCDEGTAPPSTGCVNCTRAAGWACPAPGQTCTSICGDGLRVGNEECDNGNNNSNSGLCTLTCETATCDDGLQLTEGPTAETFTDCGGDNSCPRCANNLSCVTHEDCLSNYCTPAKFCATPLLNADTWTFNVSTLDVDKKKTIPVTNLLANDGSNGDLAGDAVFTIKTQPTCGTVSVAGGVVTFTDGDPAAIPPKTTCPWGQTFTYQVCSPTSAEAIYCSTANVTVNVNHAPTLSFPDICLPLTTTSATVNASSAAVFLDPDANPWGSFPTAPSFVSYVPSPPDLPAKTATVTTSGASITLTPDGGPAGGTYTVNVAACDNVVGVNVTDPAEHEACTATTPWVVKWQASLDLREYNDANPYPVSLSGQLAFPLGEDPVGSTTNSVIVGPAPSSAIVTVSRYANGPFATTANTSVPGSTCAFVDDADPTLRKVTYTAATNAGNDSCYVQVCEPCGTLNLCNITRIPVVVASNPDAIEDSRTALDGKGAAVATGTYPILGVSGLTGNDTSIAPASFTLVNWNTTTPAAPASTDCGGTVTIDNTNPSAPVVSYLGPVSPAGPCTTTDKFKYRVESPAVTGLYDYATVTITINLHPTASDDTAATNEDTTLVLSGTSSPVYNDTDPETSNANLKISQILVQPASGSVQVGADGRTVTFVPGPADYNGAVTFDYELSDGFGGTDVGTVSITINAVPDIVADALGMEEDGTLVFDPVAGTGGASADNFEGATPLVVKINGSTDNPATVTNGSVSRSGNVLTFTPTADYHGAVPAFTYTVSSGNVEETANVTITISPVVDIVADTTSTPEDTNVVIDTLANDQFEGTPTITAVTQGDHGAVTINGGATVTYDPDPDFNGADSFTYTVTSGGKTETATVDVTVTAVADIVADLVTATEDVDKDFYPIAGTGTDGGTGGSTTDTFTGTPLITHINGTPITAGGSAVTVTDGTVKLATGNKLTFRARPDYNGAIPAFTYTVSSGGVSETANVTVSVTAATDANNDSATTDEDTAVAVNVFTNDTFSDPARKVTATTNGTNGAVTITNDTGGVVTYTPNANTSGSDSFTYTVTSAGLTETATVNVTVNAINDPPSLTANVPGATPDYIEGDSESDPLFSGAVASAFETENLEALVLTVSNVAAATAANQRLFLDGTWVPLNAHSGTTNVAFNNMSYTVTLPGTTATVTLTKTGGITKSAMETLVNGITYRNTGDDPAAGIRNITLTRIDDVGLEAPAPNDHTTNLSIVSPLNVIPVNDEPTLSVSPQTPSFTEDLAASDLFNTVTASTIEAGQTLTRLDLTVSTAPNGALERLSIDGTIVPMATTTGPGHITTALNGMTVAVDTSGSPITVSITKAAGISAGAMQTLIDNILYSNTSQDPTAGAREVTIVRLDDNGANGGANGDDNTATFASKATVTVVPVNDPPTLTATGFNPSYDEATAPVALFNPTAINTVEALQTIKTITLTVTNVVNTADEKLTVENTTFLLNSGVSGTTGGLAVGYNVTGTTPRTVTLTHSGLSVSEALTVIAGIKYSNTNTNSTAGPRVATITLIQDSGGTSNGGVDSSNPSVASTVTVNSVNNPPLIANLDGDNLSYLYNGVEVYLDQPSGGRNAAVTDADSANFSGGTITVKITEGYTAGDNLGIAEGNLITKSGTGGATLKYNNSTTIGSWELVGNTLTVTMTSGATPTTISALFKQFNLTSSNNSTGATRKVEFIIDDGDGNGASTPAYVLVYDVNDPPTLQATAVSPSFTEGDLTGADLFNAVTVNPVENGQELTRLDIEITNVTDGSAETLTIDGKSIALVAGTTGSDTTNTITYTVTAGAPATTLTIKLEKADGITPGTLASIINAISYSNSSQDPTPAGRVVSFKRLDDDGINTPPSGNSTTSFPSALPSTVTVIAVNDLPVITGAGSTLTYNEGEAAKTIDSSLEIDDLDDDNMQSATVTISLGYVSGQDVLALVPSPQNGITGVFSAGTLTLSGTATREQYESALETVTYVNTDTNNPTAGTRTITWVVKDATGGNSAGVTSSVTVTSGNDAPNINGAGATLAYIENDGAKIIDSDLQIVDPDSTNLSGATITISTFVSGEDVLALAAGAPAGVTVQSYTGGVLTLTGTASKADYELALEKVTYENTSNSPTTANRTITWVVTDDLGASSDAATSTITIASQNDAPTDIALDNSDVDENAGTNATVGTFSTTDADVGNTFTYTLVAGAGDTDNGAFNISGSTLRATSSFNFEAQSSYSIRVQTKDNANATYEKVFTISVNDINEAPTGADKTVTTAQDTPYVFVETDFGFSDPDAGDSLVVVTIESLPLHGILTLDTVPVLAADDILASDIALGDLVFTPDAGEFGTPYADFTFSVGDGALFSVSTKTITINVNDAPTDISLSNSSVAEDATSGATVGTLSSTDTNSGDTFTYTLVSGTGSDDNSAFTIDAGSLKTNATFDRETKETYLIRVRSTDEGGLFYEEALVITITGVNDNSPVFSTLAAQSIPENTTAVVTLVATDADLPAQTVIYSITGGADSGKFTLTGADLSFTPAPDYEAPTDLGDTAGNNTYVVQVTADDGNGQTTNLTITVTVTNVNEDPTNTGTLPLDFSATLSTPTNVNLSPLELADVDAGGNDLTLKLVTTAGALSAADAGGVAVTGSGTTTLQLTGSLSELNAFIDNTSAISYVEGTVLSDTVTVSVSDLGNSGSGGGSFIELDVINVTLSN